MKDNVLVFASNNAKKLKEIRPVLSEYQIKSLAEINCFDDIPETANTFQGNAFLKAKHVWDNYDLPCFADDSGLVVPELNNEPGVYSARYAGSQKNDNDNMDLLLKNLSSSKDRSAYFITVICYYDGKNTHFFEGRVNGKITLEKKGQDGFGYDPIFIPEGFDRTFAEMNMEEKNALSHRAKAVKLLRDFLAE